MKSSVALGVVGAIVVGSVGGWWLASKPAAATVAARAFERSVSPRPGAASPDATSTPVISEHRIDAREAYASLRDDVNPKPRLRLIEDWSRTRAPGTSLDLLTQAMVDPDEEVRTRAQDLFERGLAADTHRDQAPPAILTH